MSRGIKKRAISPPDFTRVFNQVSKAALIDALFCASQLGTDESLEQITQRAAKEAQIALMWREDRVPPDVITLASAWDQREQER